MSRQTDAFKAAFLPKSKLRDHVASRAAKIRADIKLGLATLNKLAQGDPVRFSLMSDALSIDNRLKDLEADGADDPGMAYKGMAALRDEAAAFATAGPATVAAREKTIADMPSDYDRAEKLILDTLEAVRLQRAQIANDRDAKAIGDRVLALAKRIADLSRATKGLSDDAMKQVTAIAKDAEVLLDDARKAVARPPAPGSAGAASKGARDAIGRIPELGAFMGSTERVRGGRTVAEDAGARLLAFDEHFAAPTDTEAGRVGNQAMRLAASLQAMSRAAAAKVNDPNLEPRLAAAMAKEYTAELARETDTAGRAAGALQAGEAGKAVRLAGALVADDPVGKLMTGKITFEDAVQRIRDQAALGGTDATSMLRMLRQQFEMRVGSQTMGEIKRGNKASDGGRPFDLSELPGELSERQATGMVEFDKNKRRALNLEESIAPVWGKDGLALTPDAQALIDRLATEVGAWDQPLAPQPDQLLAKAPKLPKGLPEGKSEKLPGKAPSADELKAGAAKLRAARERDPATYVPAPGLGQEHRVSGPLGEDGRTDQQAAHGALTERQHAHLRLLQRADDEEKAAFLKEKGMTMEAWVCKQVAERHAITEKQAGALIEKATRWFGTVPLTITFNAEDMFTGGPAPKFGNEYKSDVVLERGKAKVKDLIGRDSQQTVQGRDGKPREAEVGVTGAHKGAWVKSRGENYQRWRRDKDQREGRLDELPFEEQQLFGAVNPNFEPMRGTGTGSADGAYGANYYGKAHFLLADAVRQRCAFAVRGGGISIGGGKSAVQRRGLILMLHDMFKGGDSNLHYVDALLMMANQTNQVQITGLDWEVHLYGGFDMTKDATEIWLSPAIDEQVAENIDKFAKGHGLKCQFYSSAPQGITVISGAKPAKIDLSKVAGNA